MLPFPMPVRSHRIGPVLFLSLAAGCASGDGNGDKDSTDTDVDGSNDTYLPLVETRALPAGDPTCAFGGTEIVIGLDDGADGGVADDGQLQDGEIDSRQTICNGTDGADAEVQTYLPQDAPGGAVGTSKIIATGGDADATGGEGGGYGYGGDGGTIQMVASPGSRYGHVRSFTTGKADATFTLPTGDLSLGATPWEATASTSVPVYASAVSATNGEVFQLQGSTQLLRSTGGGGSVRITGIRVAAGVTVTFNAYNGSNAGVTLSGAIRNEGILTTAQVSQLAAAPAGTRRLPLSLTLGGYQGAPGSAIDLSGAAGSAGEPAGQPGSLSISAQPTTPGGLPFGVVKNAGRIDLSGGDGNPATPGASLQVVANLGVFNTGDLDVASGQSFGNQGGSGGGISLNSPFGPVFTASAMQLGAGSGGTSASQGGFVNISGVQVRVGGSISSNGGTPGSSICTSCSGGWAGNVNVQASAGIVVSADVTLMGGKGFNRAGSSYGGEGGRVNLSLYTDAGEGGFNLTNASIDLSGNFMLQGGDGYSGGGNGGAVYAYLSAPDTNASEIRFLGFAGYELDGGDAYYGGDGGSLFAANQATGNRPAGGVVGNVPLLARGGSGVYQGGEGGSMALVASGSSIAESAGETASNAGSADVSGGSAANYAGSGGSVVVSGYAGATNTGAITSRGGASTDGRAGAGGGWQYNQGSVAVKVQAPVVPGFGGRGALVVSSSVGEARNGGVVTAPGGAGDDGGEGGIVAVSGAKAVNTAACALPGGASSGETSGGIGGELHVHSTLQVSEQTGTPIDVKGGSGTPTGDRGYVIVDGVDVTP